VEAGILAKIMGLIAAATPRTAAKKSSGRFEWLVGY